jgi:hypothetical protein
MAMTKAKRRKRQASTASGQSSVSFVDLLKRRLSASASLEHLLPPVWNEHDEQRFQKQFNRPSRLSHSLSRTITPQETNRGTSYSV